MTGCRLQIPDKTPHTCAVAEDVVALAASSTPPTLLPTLFVTKLMALVRPLVSRSSSASTELTAAVLLAVAAETALVALAVAADTAAETWSAVLDTSDVNELAAAAAWP